MGTWKDSPKANSVRSEGPAGKASGKAPFPGVLPGSAGVSSQMNPRRDRTQDYSPTPQKRAVGVKS